MDWLTFISHVLDALAWPAAAVTIVVILRQPLRHVVASLRSLTYKGATLNFGEQVERVESKADRADLPPPEPASASVPSEAQGSPSRPPAEDEVEVLAHIHPATAVLRAWLFVEEALHGALARLGFDVVGYVPTPRALSWLTGKGVLDPQTAGVVKDLSTLRNRVAHAPSDDVSITYDSALEYADLARRAARVLDSIGVPPTYPIDPSQPQ